LIVEEIIFIYFNEGALVGLTDPSGRSPSRIAVLMSNLIRRPKHVSRSLWGVMQNARLVNLLNFHNGGLWPTILDNVDNDVFGEALEIFAESEGIVW
jgi:hypothetical protein